MSDATHALAQNPGTDVRASPDRPGWFGSEDAWAIVLGVGLLVAALAVFAGGGSLQWLAVAPQKWAQPQQALAQLEGALPRYGALFLLWSAAFGLAARALGLGAGRFAGSFLVVFLASVLILELGAWTQADHFNLEPPLVALALGLLVSNSLGVPAWLESGLRVELYIKTGIVLLGATLPLTLVLSAGPVAIVQAALVSLATFGTIYWVGQRLGLDRRFAATLGAGGAVCGVSAAIAVAGAVGARREQGAIAITIVIFWAIVMIFVLPLVARALDLPAGVAGAWIGTSEFADAAGMAAAQSYGALAGQVQGIAGSPEAAVNAFTLMKLIGRDLWIGIWAFVLSIVAVTRWESTGVDTRVGAGEIWRRFPRFVLGFLVTSALISLLAAIYGPADFNHLVKPDVVAPVKTLRTWAFTFSFLSIGLTSRWDRLAQAGARPFLAFTAGVAVNLVLGYVLSVVVFGDHWAAL